MDERVDTTREVVVVEDEQLVDEILADLLGGVGKSPLADVRRVLVQREPDNISSHQGNDIAAFGRAAGFKQVLDHIVLRREQGQWRTDAA